MDYQPNAKYDVRNEIIYITENLKCNLCLYIIIMPRTHFRFNLHSIGA